MKPMNSIRELKSEILTTKQVKGFTHCFYNYPARFSPRFSRAIINKFTQPGDIILDPFMGGGTSIIEATLLGRKSIGLDINELAYFITKVKTTIYSKEELLKFKLFADHVIDSITINRHFDPTFMLGSASFLRNVDTNNVWRLTRLLSIYRVKSKLLPTTLGDLFRCVLLKAGQWAFDNKSYIPKTNEFRAKIKELINDFVEGANEYREGNLNSGFKYSNPTLYNTSVLNINRLKEIRNIPYPKLVLTSPPYPGVHILYHRWQFNGRRETSAPYWLANIEDGHGESYYTFGPRYEKNLKKYFDVQYKAFKAIKGVINKNTIIVQLLAFPQPEWQLKKYLEVMQLAGYKETDIELKSTNNVNRIWREVPNRKWYSQINKSTQSNKEVLFVHKLI